VVTNWMDIDHCPSFSQNKFARIGWSPESDQPIGSQHG
jgi:hypothetical protein